MGQGALAGTAGRIAGRRRLGPGGAARLGAALLATGGAMAAAHLGLGSGRLLQRWSHWILAALRIRPVLERPLPEGARLWVANHLSWLDPLLLLALRPSGVLAKREVAGYPLVGPAAARAGLRFVERGDPVSRAAALAALAAELRRGGDFLLFPEGTTHRGHQLGRVHTGGLLAAHRLGVPTLPIRIDCEAPGYPWVGDATLLPHLQELAVGPPLEVRLRPGPCLHPREFADPYEWLTVVRRHLAPRIASEPEAPI